jgi:hypothetical protein
MRRIRAVFLVFIVSVSFVRQSDAQKCAPPPGFVDVPAPAIAATEELVSHTEEITIDRPFAVVLDSLNKPLKDTIHKTSALPGVSGDYTLSKISFGLPGSRRIVCLTDGSTLQEQVLTREQTGHSSHFRYVVWHYTSAQARPIDFGVGDFLYTDLGSGRTHITWTYSFKLKEDRFPGYLGAFGRYLFRVGFLDHQYAAMMRGTLDGTKANVEQ